jgi:PAS domain-containing protein
VDFGRTPPTHIAEQRPSSIPLDALLALTREGFAYVGSDARVLAWNAPAADLTGLPSERVLDHDIRSVLVDGAAIVAVPFDGLPRSMRVGVNARDGVRWLAAAVVGVNTDSHTHGWLCSFGPERRHREIEQLKKDRTTQERNRRGRFARTQNSHRHDQSVCRHAARKLRRSRDGAR